MTEDLIEENLETETVPALPKVHRSERASRAEMLFAGHYLNIFGILLLVTGLASYLKSSGASSGMLESMLGGALGVVLLIIGEYFYRKGLKQYSHPVLTGGFCLLFFTACSAHFRHELMGQETLFALLLPLVICSNASVFRYDSKMIGNVMLVVYFFTPLFITFTFQSFSIIFFYLLAINLGSTIVAFHKKWDFQLLVSSLGSYALYFAHFRSESNALNSLLLLFVIYGLSLLANNILYFFRPEASDYNLVLSFVNPTVFAILSAVTILALPNWARVSAYCVLALIHGVIAFIADDRRGENSNFLPLATSSLSLCLLFSSAAISFVTYFSDSTTYFGLVTLLWFGFALALLAIAFKVDRHSVVLSRFSYFGMLLAVAQVVYVLPSMVGSQMLQVASLGLYASYFLLLFARRENLSLRQGQVFKLVGFSAAPLTIFTVGGFGVPVTAAASFGVLALLCSRLPLDKELKHFRVIPLCFAVAALCYGASPFVNLGVESSWLPLLTASVGFSLHIIILYFKQIPYLWVFIGMALIGVALLPVAQSISLTCCTLALCHTLLVFLGSRVRDGELLAHCALVCSLLICRFAYFSWNFDNQALVVVLLVLGASSLLATKTDYSMNPLDYVFQGLLVLKVVAIGYDYYPMLCLVLGASLAFTLSKWKLPRIALFVHCLIAVGVLYVPIAISAPLAVLGMVVIPGSCFAGYLLADSESAKGSGYSLMTGLGTFAFMKFSFCLQAGPLSTLLWGGLAMALLAFSAKNKLITNWNEVGQGVFDYSRVLFFFSFVKSVLIDASSFKALGFGYFLLAFMLSAVFLVSGHAFVKKREVRNYFVILGLLVSCFHLTLLSHSLYGDRLIFQPVLSGFWSLVGFVVIAVGVAATVKVYRMFGLTTLVGNTLKILFVDIHVLDSYSQVNTYLILGTLLMMTSFLYQKQKDRLCGIEPAATNAPAPVPL